MYLNLGSGGFRQNKWINVDYSFAARSKKQMRHSIDVQHNLMWKKPMPFEDNSIEAVYTEHCIEHLTNDAVKFLFNDVKRILKPGFPFRMSCPDADIIYEMYMDPKVKKIGMEHKLEGQSKMVELMDALATPISKMMINQNIEIADPKSKEELFGIIDSIMEGTTKEEQEKNPGYHNTWWNFYKLNEFLLDAGFRKIKQRGIRESRFELFQQPYIDKTTPQYSIRVECSK